MYLSYTVMKIWHLEDNGITIQTSWGHVTIRLAMGHFLWVVHCDHASILHCYGDLAPQIWIMMDGQTDERTYACSPWMDAQVILYGAQCCYALNWTDN